MLLLINYNLSCKKTLRLLSNSVNLTFLVSESVVIFYLFFMCLTKKEFVLNGVVYKFQASFTVLLLLEYLGFNTDLIVIDLNGMVLQREYWSQTNIVNKDKIEILTIAGGG